MNTLICAKPCANYAKIFAEQVERERERKRVQERMREKEKSSGTSQQLQFRCKLNENTKDVINFLIIFTFGANWFVNQTLRNCCAWFNEHVARRSTPDPYDWLLSTDFIFSICYEKSLRPDEFFAKWKHSHKFHSPKNIPTHWERVHNSVWDFIECTAFV